MTEVARTIPLSKLVPSEANVRRTNADAGLGELAASIKVHGILQNLIVRRVKKANDKQAGTFEVVAGGRRYAALNLLVQEEHISRSYPVPCNVRDDDNPVEISLAENVVRAPIHPADQFEAFAKLHTQGFGASEIAGRFGVSPLLVEQRLKLAGVSPKLMDVYREGSMTLEQLMAFTITDNHEAQERVWFESPLHDREPHGIRRALTRAMVHGTDRRACFIGAEAYETAGGVIVRDLFHTKDEGYFADSVLLDTLVSDKLKEVAEQVKAEGWAWVEILPETDYGYLARMGRVQPITVPLSEEDQARLNSLSERYDLLAEEHGDDPSAEASEELDRLSEEVEALNVQTIAWAGEDKARAGVAIALDFTGTLRIERGLLKPEEKSKVRQEEPAPEVEERSESEPRAATQAAETAALPDALLEDLSAHRTAALRAVLARNPEAALTALLHTLVLRTFYSPLCEACVDLRLEIIDLRRFASGISESKAMQAMAECHKAWRERLPVEPELWTWLMNQELDTKLSLLAYCTSTAVNAVVLRYGGIGEKRRDQANLIATATSLEMADWWEPTKASYFDHVTKAAILIAVEESTSAEIADTLRGFKKAAMAMQAEQLLAGKRWLPLPLRSSRSASRAEQASAET